MASARLSKVSAQCIFCAHLNPAGAKFCNDCGSPLHLKPCRQCDAINDRAARRCYKCGIEDPVAEPTPEVVPKVLATEDIVGSAAPGDVGIEAAPATQQLSGAKPREEISLPDDDATTMAREPDAVVAAPEPSVADGDVRFASAVIAPEVRAAERPRQSRWALTGVLSATLMAAVAVYFYRTDLSPQQPREAPYATRAPAAATEPIPAKIDVPVASRSAFNAVSTSGTASPLPQDEARAPAPPSAGKPAPPSSLSSAAVPSQPEPAANEPAAPAIAAATKAGPVGDAPTAPPAVTAEARDSRAAVPSPVAKKSTTTAKTTAKKAKKTPTKKLASTPATPAAKAATTTEAPKSAE